MARNRFNPGELVLLDGPLRVAASQPVQVFLDPVAPTTTVDLTSPVDAVTPIVLQTAPTGTVGDFYGPDGVKRVWISTDGGTTRKGLVGDQAIDDALNAGTAAADAVAAASAAQMAADAAAASAAAVETPILTGDVVGSTDAPVSFSTARNDEIAGKISQTAGDVRYLRGVIDWNGNPIAKDATTGVVTLPDPPAGTGTGTVTAVNGALPAADGSVVVKVGRIVVVQLADGSWPTRASQGLTVSQPVEWFAWVSNVFPTIGGGYAAENDAFVRAFPG